MNARVLDHRKEKKKINYDTTVMTRLVQTQNKIIHDELLKLGLNLQLLNEQINIAGEMNKRSEAAYAAVKARVDKAKRAEGTRLAGGSSGGSGGRGSGAGGGVVAVGGTIDSLAAGSSTGSAMATASSTGSVAGAVAGVVPRVPSVSGVATVVSTAVAPVNSNVVQPGRPEVELAQPTKVRMRVVV